MRYFPALLRQTGLAGARRTATPQRPGDARTQELEVDELRVVTPTPPPAAAAGQAVSPHVPPATPDIPASPPPPQPAPAVIVHSEPQLTARPVAAVSEAPAAAQKGPPIVAPGPAQTPVRDVPVIEVLETRIVQTPAAPPDRPLPSRAAAAAPHRENPAPPVHMEPAAAQPAPHPIYFAEVREWVAAPLRQQAEVRETSLVKERPTLTQPPQVWERTMREVFETAASQPEAAPRTESFSLSIGSIHVTVEEPAVQAVKPPPAAAPAAPAPAGALPFDATRLSRQYVSF